MELSKIRVAIDGPGGAGKSTVAELLIRWGIPSLDTDAIYHELLLPPSSCLDELVTAFGTGILTSDGHLNRPALASLVFDPRHAERLDTLNRITHYYILEQVRIRCDAYEAQNVPAVLIDAPVLFESGFDKECDRTLAVLAAPSVRLSRIMERDGLSHEASVTRMKAQPSDDFYIQRADTVVYNNGDVSPEVLASHIQNQLLIWGVSI